MLRGKRVLLLSVASTLSIVAFALNYRLAYAPSIGVNGTHWDFTNRSELRVFLQTNSGSTGWTDSYLDDAYEAISDWETCIRSFVSRFGFSYLEKINFDVSSREGARVEGYDILIAWIDHAEGPALARTEILSDSTGATVRARILVSLFKPDGMPLSHAEIKALISEEIGHTLGLGHSDIKGDLMFGVIDSANVSHCHSTLDVYALAKIYEYLGSGTFQPLPSAARIRLDPGIPYSFLSESKHIA